MDNNGNADLLKKLELALQNRITQCNRLEHEGSQKRSSQADAATAAGESLGRKVKYVKVEHVKHFNSKLDTIEEDMNTTTSDGDVSSSNSSNSGHNPFTPGNCGTELLMDVDGVDLDVGENESSHSNSSNPSTSLDTISPPRSSSHGRTSRWELCIDLEKLRLDTDVNPWYEEEEQRLFRKQAERKEEEKAKRRKKKEEAAAKKMQKRKAMQERRDRKTHVKLKHTLPAFPWSTSCRGHGGRRNTAGSAATKIGMAARRAWRKTVERHRASQERSYKKARARGKATDTVTLDLAKSASPSDLW